MQENVVDVGAVSTVQRLPCPVWPTVPGVEPAFLDPFPEGMILCSPVCRGGGALLPLPRLCCVEIPCQDRCLVAGGIQPLEEMRQAAEQRGLLNRTAGLVLIYADNRVFAFIAVVACHADPPCTEALLRGAEAALGESVRERFGDKVLVEQQTRADPAFDTASGSRVSTPSEEGVDAQNIRRTATTEVSLRRASERGAQACFLQCNNPWLLS